MKKLITSIIKKKIILTLLTSLTSGVIFIVGGIAMIIILIVIMFVGAGEETETDGLGCSTAGGDLTMAQMKANFEPNAKGGILEGKSQYLLDLAKRNKIPQSLFVAILAQESGWGKSENAKRHNNVASLMGNSNQLWGYKTVEDNLEHYAKILKSEYIDKGLTTPETIGPKYAPTVGATNDGGHLNNNWISSAKTIMAQLEGKNVKDSKTESNIGCTNHQGETLEGLKKYNGDLPKTKHQEFDGNAYAFRQCTWWVYNRRLELGLPCDPYFGNGGDWGRTAPSKGYSVGKKPVQGAAVSWPAYVGGAGVYGHVAFVEKVLDGGKKIHISEHNWDIPYGYAERTIDVLPQMEFIYDKKK
ncbi:CHAP domain-containing protein [Staphylococcus aureus]|uniref:CHAP domain-containing protein n=1 Tax=Staphylococcus aureus TaxID=1280 RepID=UPI00215C5BCB|nr:CHAP domain-containing protein [Staphylococcus aureus]UVI86657.1 CHAP domain-containing protein [Staphylococcus aureus]UVJ27812.1 CHAP domain-containing protein [Staphylococcus aureus]